MEVKNNPLEDFYKTVGEAQESLRKKSAADLENTVKAVFEIEITEIQRRIEDLEERKTDAIPIPQLTPNDGLEEVKKAVNFIINYINIGIKR